MASDYFRLQVAAVPLEFERLLGLGLRRQLAESGAKLGELLQGWDADKGGLKRVDFRRHVRSGLKLSGASNHDIDRVFDEVAGGGGAALASSKALKPRLEKALEKAALREPQLEQAEAAAAAKRQRAADVRGALESLCASREADAKLAAVSGATAPVALQLSSLVAKKGLKLADVLGKWGASVSRAAFRAHVGELGVVAEAEAVDAVFESLDEESLGALDEADLKLRMRRLLDAVRAETADEAQLEKAALAARRAASALQLAVVESERVRTEELRAAAELVATRAALKAEAEAAEKERLERDQEEARARKRAEAEKAAAAGSPAGAARREPRGGPTVAGRLNDPPTKRGSGLAGRPPPSAGAALGVHLGFSCDKSGVSPIVGYRYHLRNHDYDLCETEWSRLPAAERSQYDQLAPPLAGSYLPNRG